MSRIEEMLENWPNDFLDCDPNLMLYFSMDSPVWSELAYSKNARKNTVKTAYLNGIFPWGFPDGIDIWHSPIHRFVLFPQKLKIARSLRPFINKKNYEIRTNTSFLEVLEGCRSGGRKSRESSWLHPVLFDNFITLNHEQFTISYELFIDNQLCGGIIGQKIGRIFSGDSMFSLTPNASKLILHYICQSGEYELIDCQTHTPYLESMGGEFMDRKIFLENLYRNVLESNCQF